MLKPVIPSYYLEEVIKAIYQHDLSRNMKFARLNIKWKSIVCNIFIYESFLLKSWSKFELNYLNNELYKKSHSILGFVEFENLISTQTKHIFCRKAS